MSRHGYTENEDIGGDWQYIRWRGQVASAFRGARGQAFLRETIEALDALPEKKLASASFAQTAEDGALPGLFCTLGAVGRKRGIDMRYLEQMVSEEEDVSQDAGATFGVARAMAAEIMYENDEGPWDETPEQRWMRMRRYLECELIEWDAPAPEAYGDSQ